MRKFILTLLLLNISLFAMASTFEDLNALEDSIFGYDYKSESDAKRLDRIEKYLYGEKNSGSVVKRIEKIKNDIGFMVVNPVETNRNDDSLTSKSNQEKTAVDNDSLKKKDLKEDSSVDYPIVDKLEQEIFKTTYKQDNIYDRLTRLEEKVFSKTSNEDLNVRVDNLASVINPKFAKKQNFGGYTPQQLEKYYTAKGYETLDDNSIVFQIAALEENILRNEYNNDNISRRLCRLEEKLFKKTFSSDTDVTRLQRLLVAYDAKKDSIKYENNRRIQNMAAMSQIGGILLMILAILL